MNSAEELRRTIKEEIVTFLEAPLDYPQGFKSWLISYLSASNLRLPRSAVNGLYTVADSIAELGEPAHGRPCMVRVGSDPYDWVQMTYDDIAGLWVSTQTWSTLQIEWHTPTTTSYTDLNMSGSNWDQSPVTLTYVGDKITAGLKPQVSVAGILDCAASGTTYLQASIQEFNSGDTALSTGATGGEISHNTETATYKASDWVDMTVTSLTEKYALLVLQSKYATAAPAFAGIQQASASFRWVADPA